MWLKVEAGGHIPVPSRSLSNVNETSGLEDLFRTNSFFQGKKAISVIKHFIHIPLIGFQQKNHGTIKALLWAPVLNGESVCKKNFRSGYVFFPGQKG